MQGFVYVQDSSGIGRTGIRSASHAAALISILQLAAANNEGGILGSLGPGGRTAWMEANHDDFYRAGGPLSGFRQISVAALMGHLRAAETQARAMYDRDHSNDPTGVEHEDIPHWANLFFRLFEARDSIPSAAALAAEVRRERTSVVRSITGQQASLGSHTGPGTVQLRTETTRNVGSAFQRRRHVGNVNVERLDDNAMNALQEGRDDDYNQRPAQRRRFPQNGTRHRNATFGAGMNDPMSRYGSLEYGFESVGILSRSIRDSMNAPLPSPVRTARNIGEDYQYAREQFNISDLANDADGRLFWRCERQNYANEAQRFHAAAAACAAAATVAAAAAETDEGDGTEHAM